MEFMSATVSWLVIGLLLLGAELLTGTFVMVMFGVSALVVSFLTWLNLLPTTTYQLLAFGLFCLISILLFKDKLKSALTGKTSNSYGSDFGATIKLPADLAPNAMTEVDYQGAKWTLVNSSAQFFTKNQEVKIARVDGV
jgi:membrane protein implicated in regulation of membrane protease activity